MPSGAGLTLLLPNRPFECVSGARCCCDAKHDVAAIGRLFVRALAVFVAAATGGAERGPQDCCSPLDARFHDVRTPRRAVAVDFDVASTLARPAPCRGATQCVVTPPPPPHPHPVVRLAFASCTSTPPPPAPSPPLAAATMRFAALATAASLAAATGGLDAFAQLQRAVDAGKGYRAPVISPPPPPAPPVVRALPPPRGGGGGDGCADSHPAPPPPPPPTPRRY
jgi:hypothetical protein